MKKNFFFQGLVLIAAGLFMTACTGKTAGNTESGDSLTLSGLNPAFFATDSTALYALTNPNGMEV